VDSNRSFYAEEILNVNANAHVDHSLIIISPISIKEIRKTRIRGDIVH